MGQPCPGVAEHFFVCRPLIIKVKGVIPTAERKTTDTRPGSGNLRCRLDPPGRLDDGQQVEATDSQPRSALRLGDYSLNLQKRFSGFHLGQHDPVQPGANCGGKIVLPKHGVHAIDPHVVQTLAGSSGERSHYVFPGFDFLGNRDRVLEVENHRVRPNLEHFFNPSGVICRGKQKAAQDCQFTLGHLLLAPGPVFTRLPTAVELHGKTEAVSRVLGN